MYVRSLERDDLASSRNTFHRQVNTRDMTSRQPRFSVNCIVWRNISHEQSHTIRGIQPTLHLFASTNLVYRARFTNERHSLLYRFSFVRTFSLVSGEQMSNFLLFLRYSWESWESERQFSLAVAGIKVEIGADYSELFAIGRNHAWKNHAFLCDAIKRSKSYE